MSTVVAVNYSRDAGWSGGLMAELCRDIESTVIVTFNYDTRPEIGVYRQALPATTFTRVVSELQRSGYQRLPAAADVPPETKFVTVGERLDGQPLPTVRQFDLLLVPPAVTAFGQQVEPIIDEIRNHRLRVIHGQAAWSGNPLPVGAPLGVRVELRNTGTLPAALGNPLGAPTGSWCGLRLYVYDVAERRESSVDLQPQHLRAAPGAPTDPTATLLPGGVLAFEVKKKVYLLPGDYQGRISYQNITDDPEDPQLVRGELALDLGPLRVAPP